MKFSCDQCSAQYMIADEKVGDRGVKVKCKKCDIGLHVDCFEDFHIMH